jgi:hypothetical protein
MLSVAVHESGPGTKCECRLDPVMAVLAKGTADKI